MAEKKDHIDDEELRMQREEDEQRMKEISEAATAEALRITEGVEAAAPWVSKTVKSIVNTYDLQQSEKDRVFRLAMRQIADLKAKAKAESEKKVLEQFEGKIDVVSGKYVPVGVDENFKKHVWAGESWSRAELQKFSTGFLSSLEIYADGLLWKASDIFERIVGKGVDSDKFHEIVQEAEAAKENVAQLERQLALLRAAQKSTKDVLGMAGAGMLEKITSGNLVKMATSPVGGAKDFMNGMYDKYFGKDIADARIVSDELARATVRMKEKVGLRDAVLAKLESLRGAGEELFEKAFGPEVEALLDMKDKDPNQFKTEYPKLEAKVAQWAKKTGRPHMVTLFHDKIGIKEVTGEETMTDLDKSERRRVVAKWLRDVTGAPVPGELAEEVVQKLVNEDETEMLKSIRDDKYDKKALAVLKFLFSGEYKSLKLKKSRRATVDADNLVDYMGFALEYARSGANLDQIMKRFADEWRGVSANDFDEYFDRISRGEKAARFEEKSEKEVSKEERKAKAEKEKKKRKKRETKEAAKEEKTYWKELWENITGEELDKKGREELIAAIEASPFKSRYERVFRNAKKVNLMKVYFQGHYSTESDIWVSADSKWLPASLDNFMKVLGIVDRIVDDISPDEERYKQVFEAFIYGENYRGRTLNDLDFTEFEKIHKDLAEQEKAEEKEKKAKKKKKSKKGKKRGETILRVITGGKDSPDNAA